MMKITKYVFELARTRLKSLLALSCLGAALVLPASAATYGGLSFDGTSQYVDFGTATNLGSPTFTVETWFNWNGAGVIASTGSGGVSAIPLIAKCVGEADGNNQDGNYFLGIRPSDGLLAADFEEGSTGSAPGLNHPVYGVTPVTSAVWHHAAATYDGASWRIYLDGNLETTLSVGQPPRWDSIQHTALASALRSTGAPYGYFAGTLDEARIWNYARSGAQIAASMSQQITSAPGLLGRWSLNETNGTVANDSSGHGVNGTLLNGPVWAAGYPGFAAFVGITTPADGTAFLLPTNVVISASAGGFSGTVTNVAFFAGASLLSNVTNSPYTWTWTNPPAGAYALTAVGMDNGGVRATSAVVNISVQTNLPPAVALTSPTNNAAYAAPANVTVTATATDSLGISKVEFYQGVSKLYTATTTPYSFLWGSVPAGSYQLRAVATDLGGLAATFATPTNITLTATASDPDGTVTNVEFYAGGGKIGQSATTPYSLVWSVASGGSSQLYAVATDNAGMRATSAPVNVVFTGNVMPTVAITNPVTSTTFGAPANLLISATASDADGSITNVAFYAGASLLGQVKTSPFNYTWTSVPAGSRPPARILNASSAAAASDRSGT
ncbi:MAG: Ig-like domain-containing protein [Verrucomicrobia bacterium]|nr:Ig-like domain-containing protein [Verrucomicrobiota bacterium]